MKRKAAFAVTIFMTVLLMILRIMSPSLGAFSVGPLSYNDCLLVLTLVAVAVICVLSFSKNSVAIQPGTDKLGAINGWVCTFCGAVVTMSAVLDTFCWIMYDQIPPPSTLITNGIDRIVLLAVLLFGTVGGIALVVQGFSWMSQSNANKTLRSWLALTPVLWMWFRLARYEISYASTIDISESFFNFAILVFASLFFLQLARMVSGVGAQPKNALLIFSLLTAMIALSGAPSEIAESADGHPIGFLLVAIGDMIIGLFALFMAIQQVFGKPPVLAQAAPDEEEPEEESVPAETTFSQTDLAWTEPAREHPPLEPAFEVDQVLPPLSHTAPADHKPLSTVEKFAVVQPKEAPAPAEQPAPAPTPVVAPAQRPAPAPSPTPAPQKDSSALTVDDILSELDSF